MLYELQHGFREKRSCETYLIELTEKLVNSISSGKQTDLIQLDFSKAFDKVNHQKLLFILQEYGVSPQILNWTRSFHIGRSQTVVLDGDCSNEVPVTPGVPQVFVLGPLLFLAYINQLPSSISTFQVRLFADNTADYLTITSQSDSAALQQDLDRLQEWEHDWDMEFNPSKCQVLHITRNKDIIMHQYKLCARVLESVSDAKYLGLDLSSDLNFNTHISRATTSANKSLGFLMRNITTLNERVKELAYNAMVRPRLEYASTVWCPHTKTNIDKVEQVQRRAARWVKREYSPLSGVTALQKDLVWRSLEHRKYDARLITFYKIVHKIVAIELPHYIQTPSRFTRHKHPLSFRQLQVNTDFLKFSFYPQCITLWNRLPAHIATLSDLIQFKRAVAGIKY
ncbi:MAG: reverse transcriptase family protein [Candidatus Thiodiazotropha taylori]|nr:reverse transcriptase family protein [Candidatus Thiodiazotropha taylori]